MIYSPNYSTSAKSSLMESKLIPTVQYETGSMGLGNIVISKPCKHLPMMSKLPVLSKAQSTNIQTS